MSMGKQVEVYFTIIDESARALLVTDGVHEVWLPKSQVSVSPVRGAGDSDVKVSMPSWLAQKTGIIEKK